MAVFYPWRIKNKQLKNIIQNSHFVVGLAKKFSIFALFKTQRYMYTYTFVYLNSSVPDLVIRIYMQPKISIDKIRATFKICDKNYHGFTAYLQRVFDHPRRDDEMHKEDVRPMRYKYSFTVYPTDEQGKRLEGALFVQFCYNGGIDGKPNNRLCRVEFNPNKGMTLFQDLRACVKLQPITIESMDVAFDFACSFDKLIVLPSYSKTMSVSHYGVTTHYICPDKKNGRVKCYDKQVERKKMGIDIAPTTRIEASFGDLGLNFGILRNSPTVINDKMVNRIEEVNLSLKQVGILSEDVDDPLVILLLSSPLESRTRFLRSKCYNTRKKLIEQMKASLHVVQLDTIDFTSKVYDMVRGIML